jgi:hypothetical protein
MVNIFKFPESFRTSIFQFIAKNLLLRFKFERSNGRKSKIPKIHSDIFSLKIEKKRYQMSLKVPLSTAFFKYVIRDEDIWSNLMLVCFSLELRIQEAIFSGSLELAG